MIDFMFYDGCFGSRQYFTLKADLHLSIILLNAKVSEKEVTETD